MIDRSVIQDDYDNEFILDAQLFIRRSGERGYATRSRSAHSLGTTSHRWIRATTVLACAGYCLTFAIPKLQEVQGAEAAYNSGIGGGTLHADAASGIHNACAAAPH